MKEFDQMVAILMEKGGSTEGEAAYEALDWEGIVTEIPPGAKIVNIAKDDKPWGITMDFGYYNDARNPVFYVKGINGVQSTEDKWRVCDVTLWKGDESYL